MTNVLLLYPDIPQAAADYSIVSGEGYETEDMGAINTFRGERFQHWKSDISGGDTIHRINYRLAPSSGGKSASFLYVSRLDYLAGLSASTIALTLERSTDDVTYTAEHTESDVSAATLTGVWGNDYLATFTESSAYEYWRVQFEATAGDDFNVRTGKIYFGNAFDFDADVNEINIDRVHTGSMGFVSDGGIISPGRVKHPTYDITIEWVGITDLKLESFYSEVASKRHTTTFVIYASTFDDLLDSQSLIHVKLVSVEHTREFEDYNRIRCRFMEAHG